jgi:hypothetical protein
VPSSGIRPASVFMPDPGGSKRRVALDIRTTETGDVCLSADRCRAWRDLGAGKVQIERSQPPVTLQNRPRGNRRFVPNAAGWFPFCKNQPVSSAGRSKLIFVRMGRNLPNGGKGTMRPATDTNPRRCSRNSPNASHGSLLLVVKRRVELHGGVGGAPGQLEHLSRSLVLRFCDFIARPPVPA